MQDVERERQILFITMWNYATEIKSGIMFSCSKRLPGIFFLQVVFFFTLFYG